jgi:hypothetical protein
MKKAITFMTLAFLILVLGCQKSDIEPSVQTEPDPVGNLKDIAAIDIYVGKNNPSGTLLVENTDDGFIFTALLVGWEFVENHIYIGLDEPSSPAPGQFPYSGTIFPPNIVSFFISYDDLGAECGTFYIAFHADVTNGEDNEGAWAIHPTDPIYWTNPAGKPIGWGAYFAFTVSCGPQINIDPATADLSTIYGQVRFRNFNINSDPTPPFVPEIYQWPDGGIMPPFEVNFSSSPGCDFLPHPDGQYLFFPQVNLITLQYIPDILGSGLFLSTIETNYSYCSQVFTVANADIDAIQFYLVERNDLSGFVFRNISVNGNEVGDEYFVDLGDGDDMKYNITGDILQAGGGFTFQAELLLEDQSGTAENNYLEIRFGLE